MSIESAGEAWECWARSPGSPSAWPRCALGRGSVGRSSQAIFRQQLRVGLAAACCFVAVCCCSRVPSVLLRRAHFFFLIFELGVVVVVGVKNSIAQRVLSINSQSSSTRTHCGKINVSLVRCELMMLLAFLVVLSSPSSAAVLTVVRTYPERHGLLLGTRPV